VVAAISIARPAPQTEMHLIQSPAIDKVDRRATIRVEARLATRGWSQCLQAIGEVRYGHSKEVLYA